MPLLLYHDLLRRLAHSAYCGAALRCFDVFTYTVCSKHYSDSTLPLPLCGLLGDKSGGTWATATPAAWRAWRRVTNRVAGARASTSSGVPYATLAAPLAGDATTPASCTQQHRRSTPHLWTCDFVFSGIWWLTKTLPTNMNPSHPTVPLTTLRWTGLTDARSPACFFQHLTVTNAFAYRQQCVYQVVLGDAAGLLTRSATRRDPGSRLYGRR